MSLPSGSTFGTYQVLEPLGRGGMASVYKAYEPGLDRHVALKVLPPEFLHDEGFAERFRREAKVIARLEHPNIIPIHGFGIEEKSRTPWMAMRLVPGGALSSAMKAGRLPPARVVAILRGVAEALDYAHGKGVIHRDVKPQNILLDEAGRVYLADFGIAKMVEGQPGLTQTGMISGTPQYMAPEQAMAATVDHRADIYALGVVAYEMLTGRVPFAADTPVAVLMKHVQDPIPVPSARDVPEPLTRVLVKALAKKPEDRWPTAGAFVDALGEALAAAPLPTTAMPVPRTVALPAPTAPARTAVTTAPPAYTSGSHPPAPTAPGRAGGGGGLVAAVIAGVVLMGVIATAALILLLRPRSSDVADRPPVTLRSPAMADGVVAGSPVLRASEAPPAAAFSAAPSPAATPTATSAAPAAPSPVRITRPTPAIAAAIPAAEPPVTLPPTPPPPAAPPPRPSGFAGAGRVETGDRFYEKTLTYAEDEALPLEAQVGPVRVKTVQFTVADRKRFGEIDDLRSEVRAVFPVECRGAGTWAYKVEVELLDESGRRLDRFGNDGRCKDEIKTVAANRGILKALVAAARGVKIRVEAQKK